MKINKLEEIKKALEGRDDISVDIIEEKCPPYKKLSGRHIIYFRIAPNNSILNFEEYKNFGRRIAEELQAKPKDISEPWISPSGNLLGFGELRHSEKIIDDEIGKGLRTITGIIYPCKGLMEGKPYGITLNDYNCPNPCEMVDKCPYVSEKIKSLL